MRTPCARDVLFGTLGILRAEWQYTPKGAVDTAGDCGTSAVFPEQIFDRYLLAAVR